MTTRWKPEAPLRLGHVLDSFRIAAAARSNGPPEPLFSRGFAVWR